MNTQQAMVRDFMLKFGQTVNDTPKLSPKDDILRVNLIHEEAAELWQAEQSNDRLLIADALADLAYVIYGAGVTSGIRLEPKKVTERDLGDADEMKGPKLIHVNGALALALSEGLLSRVGIALTSMLEIVNVAAVIHKIPLAAVFAEVNRSNMSKAWLEQEIYEMQVDPLRCDFLKAICVDAKADRGWIVHRKSDQKVQKSPSYSPAQLAPLI